LPAEPLRKFIKASADSLAPNKVDACQHARFTYHADDWVIEFSFIPKKLEARGEKDVRTLGVTSGKVHYPQAHEGIKKSLKKKASKYGDMELP